MAEEKQTPVKQETTSPAQRETKTPVKQETKTSPIKEIATPAGQKVNSPVGPEQKYNTLAIVGFILSFLFSIAGLICSIIALNQLKTKPQKGRGLAIAGIVVSGIVIFLFPILVLIGPLAYFGVLSPQAFIPSSCTMSQGFDCNYAKISPDGLFTARLRNNIGDDIAIATILIDDSCRVDVLDWRNTNAKYVECKVTLQPGKQQRTSIAIEYIKEGETLMRKANGESYLHR